jgi:hypothetical protein
MPTMWCLTGFIQRSQTIDEVERMRAPGNCRVEVPHLDRVPTRDDRLLPELGG